MKLRRPVRIVERIVYSEGYMSIFYRTEYVRLTSAIRDEVLQHQPLFQLTISPSIDRFFCAACHTPWPCRSVRWGLAALGDDTDYAPLVAISRPIPADNEGSRNG